MSSNITTMKLDVMVGEQFIHTLKMKVNPIFPVTDDEIRTLVLTKLPTLKNKNFHVVLYNK